MKTTDYYLHFDPGPGRPPEGAGLYVEVQLNRGSNSDVQVEVVQPKIDVRKLETITVAETFDLTGLNPIAFPPPETIVWVDENPSTQSDLFNPILTRAYNEHSLVVSSDQITDDAQTFVHVRFERDGELEVMSRFEWLDPHHPYLQLSLPNADGLVARLPDKLPSLRAGLPGKDRVQLFFDERAQLTQQMTDPAAQLACEYFNELDLQTMPIASKLWTHPGKTTLLNDSERLERIKAIDRCTRFLEARMWERYKAGGLLTCPAKLGCGLTESDLELVAELFSKTVSHHYDPHGGAMMWDALDLGFAHFARSELRLSAGTGPLSKSVREQGHPCEPDSAFFLFFAELADLVLLYLNDDDPWERLRALFVTCLEEYRATYPPRSNKRLFRFYGAKYRGQLPHALNQADFHQRVNDGLDAKALEQVWLDELTSLFHVDDGVRANACVP